MLRAPKMAAPRAPRWRLPRWRFHSRPACPSTARPARRRRASWRSRSRSVRSSTKHWRTRPASAENNASVMKPRTRKPGIGRHLPQEGRGLVGLQAVLAGLARGIDLHIHVQRGPSACRRRSSASATQAVRAPGTRPRSCPPAALLVCRWPMTDQQVRQVGHGLPFARHLLQLVLAQVAAAGLVGQADARLVHRLAHRQQAHAVRRAPGAAGRVGDALVDRGQVAAEILHRIGARPAACWSCWVWVCTGAPPAS